MLSLSRRIFLVLCNSKRQKGKGVYSSLWTGNPSQSYGASSPAIWDHTVLPATRHRWARPSLTPAMQAGTQFTYPGGMEGWVDPCVGYIPRCFTCPQTLTHPGTNHVIATRPGVEPMDLEIASPTSWPLHHQATLASCGCCVTGSSTVFLTATAFLKPFDHLRQEEVKRIVQTYLAYLSDRTNLISNPGILVSILGFLVVCFYFYQLLLNFHLSMAVTVFLQSLMIISLMQICWYLQWCV